MSRPWTRADALRDASDQTAEHADDMAAEAYQRDDWADDDRPTERELAADEDAARRGGWEW